MDKDADNMDTDTVMAHALAGGGGVPEDSAGDPALAAADLLGAVQRLERDPETSLAAGAARDAYLQPGDGLLVVRYADSPTRRPPGGTGLDYLLARTGDREHAGFRRATRAAGRGRADVDAAYLTELVLGGDPGGVAPAVVASAGDADAAEGTVGVVRLQPTAAMLRLVPDPARAANDLDALGDARFLLVDGLGRRRALSGAAAERARGRVAARALAYYAALLGRHARLVRTARAAAKICVEGSECDHAGVAVPPRIFFP